MGAKKGKKGKKGKKKGGAFGEDVDPTEKKHILAAELDSLNERMARAQQDAEFAVAARNEKAKHDLDMIRIEEEEIKTTNDIMADMTR